MVKKSEKVKKSESEIETTEETTQNQLDQLEMFNDILSEIPTEESIIKPESKKRGRRPSKKTPPINIIDKQTVSIFLNLPFNYLAKRYGDFWKLEKEEEENLSVLIERISNKWLPVWLERFADELSLIVLTFFIIYPRYEQTIQLKKSLKEKNATISESYH